METKLLNQLAGSHAKGTPLVDQLANFNIIVFIERYGIMNELGKKLDFKDHRFMVAPYSDMSPKQCCLKAAQIGFSTMAILKSLWLCGAKGMEVCYILPTAGDIKDFVSSKVNRMIQGNPILGTWTKDKDTIEQKHVNGHVISYRGSYVERAALMISVDLLIADEVSRSDQKVVSQYASRLQHSEYKWEWYFSNPSVPGEVLDIKWKESDMKKWHIQCDCLKGEFVTKLTDDGTKGWRILDEGCIDYTEEIFRCPDCQTVITDDMRRMGEWLPTQFVTAEGKKPVFSGYWIPIWLYPKIQVPYIKEQKKKSAEYFANFVAGLPYEAPGSRVDLNTSKRIVTPNINPQDGRIVIGADTGAGMVKYVIGNTKGLFYWAKDKNYDNLRHLMKVTYPDAVLMIDQGGDLIGNRELVEEFPGRVFLCYFNRPQAAMRLVKRGDGEEAAKVVIDRERTIQLVVDELNANRIPLNGTFVEWYEVGVEWEKLYRATEMVDNEPVRTWIKSSTPCDYPFCLQKGTLVKSIKGDTPIEELEVGDEVLTRSGYKKVTWSGTTGSKELYEIRAGGEVIKSTRDHKYFTQKGFTQVEVGDTLLVWKRLPTITEYSPDGLQATGDSIESTIGPTYGAEVRRLGFLCIDTNTKKKSVQYLKERLSTILTGIHSIITSRTSRLCHEESTNVCTLNECGKRQTKKKEKGCNLLNRIKNMYGIALKKVGNVCGSVNKRGTKKRSPVYSVVNPLSGVVENFVADYVKVDSIIKIGTEVVYDIEVDEAHEFFANNILVHNCMVYWRAGISRFMDGADGSLISASKKTNETELVLADGHVVSQDTLKQFMMKNTDDWRSY